MILNKIFKDNKTTAWFKSIVIFLVGAMLWHYGFPIAWLNISYFGFNYVPAKLFAILLSIIAIDTLKLDL